MLTSELDTCQLHLTQSLLLWAHTASIWTAAYDGVKDGKKTEKSAMTCDTDVSCHSVALQSRGHGSLGTNIKVKIQMSSVLMLLF